MKRTKIHFYWTFTVDFNCLLICASYNFSWSSWSFSSL